MNAQNRLHRKIRFRNSTFFLPERQGDNSRWKQNIKISYQQGRPTPRWGRTGQTPQGRQGMWDTLLVNDFMLSVIFI